MNSTNIAHAALAAAVIIGLAVSCAPIGTAQSTSFTQGFDDGCASGKVAAGLSPPMQRRDNARIASEPEYAKGWDQGFDMLHARQFGNVSPVTLRKPDLWRTRAAQREGETMKIAEIGGGSLCYVSGIS
ncbi:MAG: hypothetical protein EXQ89_04645 [Rhodospirillaceae bacterium]|nr:hypothetical protein [Rhodospirillaceae bacterium]